MLDTLEKKAVSTICSLYLVRMLGLFLIFPVFSSGANCYKGSNLTYIGLAVGIYGLAQGVLQIPFGICSDKYGRKKTLLFGLSVFIVGSVCAGLSESIFGVILGRALQGGGAIGCVLMASLTDCTREQVRPKAMMLVGMSIGMSFVLAMVIGPWFTPWLGLSGLFWVNALLGGAGIFLVLKRLPVLETYGNRETPFSTVQAIITCLSNTSLLILNFGIFSLHAILVSLFLVLPFWLKNLNLAGNQLGVFYLATILPAAMLTWLLLKQTKRAKVREWLFGLSVVGLVCSIIGLMLFWEGVFSLGLCLAGFWIFFLNLESLLPANVSIQAPAHARGTALGIYSSAQFLGIFVGGILSGWLNDVYGMMAPLVFSSILACSWLGMVVRSHHHKRSEFKLGVKHYG